MCVEEVNICGQVNAGGLYIQFQYAYFSYDFIIAVPKTRYHKRQGTEINLTPVVLRNRNNQEFPRG